jgi:hypothetical protein
MSEVITVDCYPSTIPVQTESESLDDEPVQIVVSQNLPVPGPEDRREEQGIIANHEVEEVTDGEEEAARDMSYAEDPYEASEDNLDENDVSYHPVHDVPQNNTAATNRPRRHNAGKPPDKLTY